MRLKRELTIAQTVLLIALAFLLVKVVLVARVHAARDRWEKERQAHLAPAMQTQRR